MADFVSGFWSWFIIIGSILSILACWWLIFSLGGKKKPALNEAGEVETMGHVWDEDLEELNNPLPRWWLYMFHITLVFGSVYLLLYPGLGTFQGLLGWSQVNEYNEEVQKAEETYGPLYQRFLAQDLTTVAVDPEAKKIGKRLFSTYCTQCHGSDARGARGYPDLTDDDWLYGGEPDMIKTTINNGRAGLMPAFGEPLGNDGVFNVAAYIQSLSGREADPVVIAKGETIFSTNCAVCHAPDGKGNQMLGAPNLTDTVWLYGGSQKRIMQTIANGRQGNMPPHGEFLGEAKVHLLSAYIYGLSQQKGEKY